MGGLYLFSLAGIPVSVSGWYFALIGYYAYSSGAARGLLFGLCVTFSLLVHEFGHGLVAKIFRLNPAILLHGLGGLCGHDRASRDRDDALIVAAGPIAGLILGGLTYLVHKLMWAYKPELMYGSEPLQLTFIFLLYVNIVWSLANLLPLWPLDGGQLFRLLMQRYFEPAKAARLTHGVGMLVGGVCIALVLLYVRSPFLVIIVGMLTCQNFTQLQSGAASGGGVARGENRLAKTLLKDAQQALEEGQPAEAARICHQLQADMVLSAASQKKVWAMLAVASHAMGKPEEADEYAQRAPDALVLSMLEKLGNTEQAR